MNMLNAALALWDLTDKINQISKNNKLWWIERSALCYLTRFAGVFIDFYQINMLYAALFYGIWLIEWLPPVKNNKFCWSQRSVLCHLTCFAGVLIDFYQINMLYAVLCLRDLADWITHASKNNRLWWSQCSVLCYLTCFANDLVSSKTISASGIRRPVINEALI